jgi:hypothetical protein
MSITREEAEKELDEEAIKAEQIKRKQKKARLLKLRVAAIGGPKFPSTPEARRGLIQETKSPTATIEGSEKQDQQRIQQEVDFINKGKPIRPRGSGKKMSTDLKRRLAKITKGNTTFDTLAPEDIDSVEDIIKNVKPLKGSKPRKDSDPIPSFVKDSKAKEHGHSIVFKSHQLGQYRAASLEGQQGKFAKYWLLNAKQTNGNGWGIAAHSAKQNMSKFIGRPLVVTSSKWHGASVYGESFDHPYIPTNDLDKIFAHQEQFRVGNIVDIGEKNGDFYATIEMLPKFANMSLPPFCSPAIYQLDAKEAEGNISKWEALHLAALDENPAYGARIALLKGTCVGTANSCAIQFKGAKQKEATVVCPVKKAKALKLKLKLAGISTHGGTPKKVDITALGEKKPFTPEDQKELDKTTGPFSQRGFREPDSKKNEKLRKRLASLGEQNMTYQDSKKIKIHKKKHPEVRKAKTSIEDILRKSGRSVDASQQSSFLSSQGDFIGNPEANSHASQIRNILQDKKLDAIDPDIVTTQFSAEHGLPRVQRFPINRAGESRVSVGIHSKINNAQIKALQDLERGGNSIGFAVGPSGTTAVTGEGSRDMMKALREHKLL